MPPNNQVPLGSVSSPAGAPVGTFGAEQQFQPPAATPQPAVNQPQKGAQPERKANSTQNSLLISELREGMVIMSDGSFRAVVACKSINFDLMSSREREGVEFSYQNFLNALYFPIQIYIRSQRVDIGPYLDRLDDMLREQDNMLLRVLMEDYMQFIDALSQEANIMDKSFFVIVPYFPSGEVGSVVEQGKGFFGKIFGGAKASTITKIDKATYEKAKDEIKNRVDSVINGLAQVGVHAVQLTTKELGELYYNAYNPDTAVREPLGDFSAVTSTYIRRGGTPPTAQPPVATPEGVSSGQA